MVLNREHLKVLDANRALFTITVPGVLATDLEYDFVKQKDILDANPYLSYLTEEEKMDMIRAQAILQQMHLLKVFKQSKSY